MVHTGMPRSKMHTAALDRFRKVGYSFHILVRKSGYIMVFITPLSGESDDMGILFFCHPVPLGSSERWVSIDEFQMDTGERTTLVNSGEFRSVGTLRRWWKSLRRDSMRSSPDPWDVVEDIKSLRHHSDLYGSLMEMGIWLSQSGGTQGSLFAFCQEHKVFRR